MDVIRCWNVSIVNFPCIMFSTNTLLNSKYVLHSSLKLSLRNFVVLAPAIMNKFCPLAGKKKSPEQKGVKKKVVTAENVNKDQTRTVTRDYLKSSVQTDKGIVKSSVIVQFLIPDKILNILFLFLPCYMQIIMSPLFETIDHIRCYLNVNYKYETTSIHNCTSCTMNTNLITWSRWYKKDMMA